MSANRSSFIVNRVKTPQATKMPFGLRDLVEKLCIAVDIKMLYNNGVRNEHFGKIEPLR